MLNMEQIKDCVVRWFRSRKFYAVAYTHEDYIYVKHFEVIVDGTGSTCIYDKMRDSIIATKIVDDKMRACDISVTQYKRDLKSMNAHDIDFIVVGSSLTDCILGKACGKLTLTTEVLEHFVESIELPNINIHEMPRNCDAISAVLDIDASIRNKKVIK